MTFAPTRLVSGLGLQVFLFNPACKDSTFAPTRLVSGLIIEVALVCLIIHVCTSLFSTSLYTTYKLSCKSAYFHVQGHKQWNEQQLKSTQYNYTNTTMRNESNECNRTSAIIRLQVKRMQSCKCNYTNMTCK